MDGQREVLHRGATQGIITGDQMHLPRLRPTSQSAHLNRVRLALSATLLACLLSGCESVPMTYKQWQEDQENRLKSEQAGQPYKTPSQLRAEAAEMRRLTGETKFPSKPH